MKYDELVDQADRLRRERDALADTVEKLKKQISGARVCTSLCSECVYAIPSYQPLGGTIFYLCELENKCADYKRK